MNKHYSIIKVKNNQHKRVLIEQRVKNFEALISIQNNILKEITNFNPTVKEKLHMTIAHIGIPEELYEEIKKVNTSLVFDKYIDQLHKFIQKISQYLPNKIVVKAETLDVFGESSHNVAVLKFVKTPEMQQSRIKIVQAIKQLILDLGIDNVDKFISQSINLRHNPNDEFVPHITLGDLGKNIKLPRIDISGISIQLKPAIISGVKKTVFIN